MAVIAVDFLAGVGLSSYLIERFGFGQGGYSHCASVLADGRYLDARWDTIAQVPPGVHIREPKTEKWIRRRRLSLVVTDEEYAAWEANLRAKITDGYGVEDIMDFIDGAERHTPGRWICSALVINAVQHIRRVPYPLPVLAHQITPDAALLVLATAGFTAGPIEVR
jgi:hypothetical protein